MTIQFLLRTKRRSAPSAPRLCTPAEYEENAEVRNEPNEAAIQNEPSEATIQNEGGKDRLSNERAEAATSRTRRRSRTRAARRPATSRVARSAACRTVPSRTRRRMSSRRRKVPLRRVRAEGGQEEVLAQGRAEDLEDQDQDEFSTRLIPRFLIRRFCYIFPFTLYHHIRRRFCYIFPFALYDHYVIIALVSVMT